MNDEINQAFREGLLQGRKDRDALIELLKRSREMLKWARFSDYENITESMMLMLEIGEAIRNGEDKS